MAPNNFVLTTLSDNPEYFEEVLRLIEEEFHYNESNHFEKDFAPLMDPLNFEHCYLYIDNESNTVAAHLAVCERTLIKNEAEMKVALIGGIATHKKFRRMHLFKGLMDHALEKHQDVGMFVLWSELENIYEKFSFHRTGGLIETGKRNFSSSERPSGYEKNKFNSLSDEDFKAIINIYSSFVEKKFFTIKRENKDWSIIKEMGSIDLYLKRDLSGNIIRYFCVNKGHDLTNIIHEIGCLNQNEYNGLLKDLESYKLWLPESEGERFKSSEVFYTAFYRMGNAETLNAFLQIITQGQLYIVGVESDTVSFKFKSSDYKASQKDFLQFLFGPRPLEEFAPFRLSLYVTGTDSI